MKVSTLALVTLVSSVAAYPGYGDVLGANEAHTVNTRVPGSRDVGSIVHALRNKRVPDPSRSEASSKEDGFGLINLDLVSPFQSMLSKDNPFVSAISKTVDAAGDMVRNIAGNIQKGTGLPLLSIGESINGVIRGLEKSDSGPSKGHESRDNEDSEPSIEIKGAGRVASKGDRTESAEDVAEEVPSEKRGIHSTFSRESSSGDAKTGTEVKKQSGRSRISTESSEKSQKERSHSSEGTGKKSLSNENGESSRGSTNVDKQEADSQVENARSGSESVKEADRKSAEA